MIRNIRYRRDQRQLEEEEEIWFNEEDDFSDVVPTSKTDIETYSKSTGILQLQFLKKSFDLWDIFDFVITLHKLNLPYFVFFSIEADKNLNEKNGPANRQLTMTTTTATVNDHTSPSSNTNSSASSSSPVQEKKFVSQNGTSVEQIDSYYLT